MTIICPRCAARFSVANTTGITCPACGAKLALRDDPSRRSSTPAPPQRRAPAPQPIIDLPVPKRALSAALDPQSGASRGGSAGSLGGKVAAARPKERWRIRSEHLAELPEPIGDQPRNPRRAAALRAGTAAKPSPAPAAVVPKAVAPMASPAPPAPPAPLAQSVPAAPKVPAASEPVPVAAAIAAPIERAMPRIPVTKPEIPAGAPTRPLSDGATDKRSTEPVANPAAATTRQELAPVPATPPAAPALARRDGPSPAPVPEPLAPSESSGGVSVRNVVVKLPAAEAARAATGGAETAVPSPAVAPAVPGVAAPVPIVPVVPVAAVPAIVLPAPERPAVSEGKGAGGAVAVAPAVPKVAAAVAPPVAAAAPAPASPVPAAAKSEPSPVAGEAADEASAPAAESGETNQAATSAETQLLDEGETPPAVQLGWVIAVLLGLAVMLVTWIVYRASVGH